MGSAPSEGEADGSQLTPVKIVVAGGFGVGKTTLVSAISEIRPLRTEESLTQVGIGVDDLTGVAGKTTTTVAMDFGRISMGARLVLYLFGTPGQDRFWFMWDDLSYGALGAVVLADTRRLSDCFPSVDYFERRQLPFIVAVNAFDGAPRYDTEDVRIALDLDPDVPALLCDARQRSSVKEVLITLVQHILAGPRDDQEAPPEPGAVGWSGPVGRPTFLLAGDPPDADLPNGNGDARDAARPAQEASRPAVDGS
jgi:signal recognition particle receptor subunit beta